MDAGDSIGSVDLKNGHYNWSKHMFVLNTGMPFSIYWPSSTLISVGQARRSLPLAVELGMFLMMPRRR